MNVFKWGFGLFWTCPCGNYTASWKHDGIPSCCTACGRLGSFLTKRVAQVVDETPSVWELLHGKKDREYLEEAIDYQAALAIGAVPQVPKIWEKPRS